MAVFDAYIRKVKERVGELRANGRQAREFDCPITLEELRERLPVRVGPEASSGIILRGDTFAELGSPEAGSCACLLWTDDPSLISNGRVTLVGPELQESEGASLPFGQVARPPTPFRPGNRPFRIFISRPGYL